MERNRTQLRGAALLMLTALIWGTAFVAQSVGMDHLGPCAFTAVRNYIGCVALLPVIAFASRLRKGKPEDDGEQVPPAKARKRLALWGASCGLLLGSATLLQQAGMQTASPGKAGFLTALYIVIVPIAGIFLHKKAPRAIWLSVALAVAAAVLMNGLPGKPETSAAANKIYPWLLVLTLLLNGTADAMSKVFAQLGRRQDDGLFMFYIFLFAGLATLVLLVRQRRSLTGRDVFFGVLVGVPNFLSSRLLLAALTELPAFLVYPCYSVGVILVISVVSFFLFRERLNGRQMGAAGMILVSLVLLNL